jgi:hypothetical protein
MLSVQKLRCLTGFMPKADHLNEELGCLKLCFAAFLAIAMLVVA